MNSNLGHRERCRTVKTGRKELCDCGYDDEKVVAARWKERWNTSYWYPGSPIFEAAKKSGKAIRLKIWAEEVGNPPHTLLTGKHHYDLDDDVIDPSLEWWFQ
jgi:hypothetical protein